MLNNRLISNRLLLLVAAGLVFSASAARADPRIGYPFQDNPNLWRVDEYHRGGYGHHDWDRGHDWWREPGYHHRGPVIVVPAHRRRHYHGIIIVRPYGHWYPGYGFFMTDAAAYRWLGLTAITFAALNLLSEQQERALEAAQVQATTAPVGQAIIWNSGDASGSVTTLRDGHSTSGLYCREFQQTVTIGGKTEQAYGTACQQPDGAWKVVSNN